MNTWDPQANDIFLKALKIASPAERAAYVANACWEDAALHEQVQTLLLAHQRAGDFLETPAPGVRPGDNNSDRDARAHEEIPGTVIGPYKLLEQIGEGGCGVVYMAEQEVPVRRRVAFKIIKLGMDTRQVVARFEAERQALAMMDHPNIAKVFDAGATETGRPYFVMELVRGVRITDYCDQHNLPTPDRLKLFIQVCHAIQHAHQKGVIHRDIKPSNILVSVHDDEPVPKVIDFGIAKAMGERLTDKTVFTRFEQFIGTPTYMSPEQAGTSGLDIDTRSDIYALGVLLYELLTGRTPFDPKQLAQAGLDEILRRIREEEPPRPSTRLSALEGEELTTTAQHRHTEPPRLISLLRGDLDWIVMKCLEKNRARRYETASGLVEDIQHHLKHEPVVARPPSAIYMLQKFARRHRTWLAVAAVVAFALAAAAAVSTWQAVRAVRAEREQIRLRQQAEANQKRAQAEANKSLEVIQFLNSMLNGAGQSVAQRRETALPREILDQTAERIATDLKNHPDVEVKLLSTLGGIYRMLGEYEKAEAMHRQALSMQRTLLGEEHPDVARSLGFLAGVLADQGRLGESETIYRQALAMQRKLLGEEHREVARSLNNLAWVLRSQGKLAEAETTCRQALAMQRKLLGEERPEVAQSLAQLASMLREESRLAEAETFARQALAMQRRLLGDEHTDVAWSLDNLAYVLREQGRLVEAETVLRQALAMRRKLLGEEHRDVAHSLSEIAGMLFNQGKVTEAETMARQALAMQKKLLGEEHPDVAVSLGLLADVLRCEGKLAEAETLCRQVLAMQNRLLGEQNWTVAQPLVTLADVLRDQCKLTEAEAVCRQALAMQRRLLGEENWQVAQSLNTLAAVLQDESKLAEAETVCRQALAMNRKLLGEEHRNVAWSLNNLAWVLRAEGKPAEAETLFRQALAMRRKLLGDDNWEVGHSLVGLAHVVREQGRLAEAETMCRQALAMFQKRLGQENPQAVQSLTQLAGVLLDQGKLAEAETLCRQALAMQRRLLGEEHRDVTWSLVILGWVLCAEGRPTEAEPLFRQVLAIRRKLFGEEHRDVAWSLTDIAYWLRDQGKLDEAESMFRQALAMRMKLLGQEHPETARLRNDLVRFLRGQRRLAEAAEVYRDGAEGDDPGTMNNLSWLLATSEDPAMRDGNKAVRLAERAVAATNRENAQYLDTLAAAYAETGRFADAVKAQQEAIDLMQDEQWLDTFAARLSLYQSGKPYRETNSFDD